MRTPAHLSPHRPHLTHPTPQVLQYLRETGYRHELQPGNDGVVLVYFGGPDSGGGVSTSYAN
jgi:hypothetical protein